MSKNGEMTGQELGEKLLKSVREMKAGKAKRVIQVASNEVAAARLKTGLSQSDFAQALHISARTLQEWEQGRRKPSGAARALIQIAFRHPQIIAESFKLSANKSINKAPLAPDVRN